VIEFNSYTSPRLTPIQARGKERIRLILSVALQLFRDKGIDHTTTNDIARAARIPIGSVYRYFKNKEEIILAIASLQIADVVEIFKNINLRPDLTQMPWADVISLVAEQWSNHAEQGDSFAYVYFVRSDKTLNAKASAEWREVHLAYKAILRTCEPQITDEEVGIYVQFTWGIVEMTVITKNLALAHQSAQILARYLEERYPRPGGQAN
jgi:AcrR family transcriptional regulator